MAELLAESPSPVSDVAALTAALARMDRVLATILDLTPAVVRVVDVSGRIVRTNELALAGQGESRPANLRALWGRDQPQRVDDKAPLGFLDTPGMRALGGLPTRGERLVVRRAVSGESVAIECSASALLGDDGKVIGAVVIERDIVEKPSREQAIEAVAPDAAVAILRIQPSLEVPAGTPKSASGLVHDVNNALNTIMAAAFLVQHRADSPDAVRDYASRIQQAAEWGAAAAAGVERMVREAQNPTDSAPPREPTDIAAGQISARGSEIAGPLDILLVEDNADGREFISRLLRTEGHRVDAVATSAEARTRLESASSAAVDLLLTDLDLPDGNGWDLAAYAKGQRSSLRVGVITGWDASVGGEEAVSAEFVLRKPLRAAVLLDHVAGRQARALPE